MDSDDSNDENFTQSFGQENIDQNENDENETDSDSDPDSFPMNISQQFLDYAFPRLLSAVNEFVRNYDTMNTVSQQDVLRATIRGCDQMMEESQFTEQILAEVKLLFANSNRLLSPSIIANVLQVLEDRSVSDVEDSDETDFERAIKRAQRKVKIITSIVNDTASSTIPQPPNYLAPSQPSSMSQPPSALSIASTSSSLPENGPEYLDTMNTSNAASTSSANINEHTVSTDMPDMESEDNSSPAVESADSRYRRSRGPVNYF